MKGIIMFSRISEIKFGTAQAGDKSVKKVEDKRLEPIFTTYNKTKAETVQQQDYADSVVDNGDYADDGNGIEDLQTEEGTKTQAGGENNKPQTTTTQEGEKPEDKNKPQATEQGNKPEATNKPQGTQEPQNEDGKTDLKAYTDYTVQEGEHFKDLIVRSLKAQNPDNEDYEPTEEEINKAIEDFKANNPEDTVKERNGKMYLLAGAKVKIAGGLEDKNNGEEQEQKWLDRIRSTRKTKRGGSAAPVQGDAGNNDKKANEKKAEEKKGSAPVKKGTNDKSKGADNKKGSAPVKNNNNEPKNLRKTYKEGVYYDEKTKTHYKKENNKWVEVEGKYGKITQYNKDGSWIEKNSDGNKTWCRADGTIIKEEYYDENGKLSCLREYDKQDHHTKSLSYENGKIVFAANYYPNGNTKLATIWAKDHTTTLSYDQNGVRTKRIEKYKDRTWTCVYQNGKTLKYTNKTSKGVETQLFDPKSGKRIRTDYPSGEIGTFTYLKNGRSLEKVSKPGIFSNTIYQLYDRNDHYLGECDSNGNLIKK